MNERAPARPATPVAGSIPASPANPASPMTAAASSGGTGMGTVLPAGAAASAAAAGGLAPTGGAMAAAGRPSVIQLVFRERGALYAAYMPLLTDGGLFVPTARDYRLGDDIYLLMSLPDDPQRFPVAGKVAWITPANASGGRTQGVGVRFPNDEKTRQLKIKIEEILGTSISSAKPTQTL